MNWQQRIKEAKSRDEIYSLFVELNEKLLSEKRYLSENRSELDQVEIVEAQGEIAILATLIQYAEKKATELDLNAERTKRLNYNVRLLIRSAISEDNYKKLIDMAYNLPSSECRKSGQEVIKLLN